jgi:hypothetical protein
LSSGIEVNKETTLKEIMISSGSTWMSFIFDRKALTLLAECGDVLTRGLRISVRYFDKL